MKLIPLEVYANEHNLEYKTASAMYRRGAVKGYKDLSGRVYIEVEEPIKSSEEWDRRTGILQELGEFLQDPDGFKTQVSEGVYNYISQIYTKCREIVQVKGGDIKVPYIVTIKQKDLELYSKGQLNAGPQNAVMETAQRIQEGIRKGREEATEALKLLVERSKGLKERLDSDKPEGAK
jgi:hypothetical protein